MDFDPAPFNIAGAFVAWAIVVGILTVVALFLGLLASFSTAGAGGMKLFTNGLSGFVKDVFSISPRRVLALTRLTLKEALRRKALLVFVVFALLLMFGGWFLTDSNNRADLQVQVHITFMLTSISWLILIVVMFLSSWGIPEDIRIRSLHTVVTKPARRIEVVLGRILGFSSMAVLILIVMGVAGYIWIQRLVPENAKDQLTCRVPVYGQLFFLDRDGLPKKTGINVGDPWLYRSFVEGNTRQRAVWEFQNVTPDNVGEELKIESRFEAFRTIKGSDDSIEGGLEARYTLVRDVKENAFASFAASVNLRDVADNLRAGNFSTAASDLKTAAERVSDSPDDFKEIECLAISIAARYAAREIDRWGNDFDDLAAAFKKLESGAERAAGGMNRQAPREFGDLVLALEDLAEIIETKSDELVAATPRVEVPLEPFRVSEYHEGDDWNTYPRALTYEANNESVSRFLATTISDLNEKGSVVTDGAVPIEFAETLANEASVSALNAERVVDVLNEEIESGTLTVADGKLAVANDDLWITFFSKLAREDRLVSDDPAGWLLQADLFDDIAPDGRLRVEVSCLNDQMYLGMARADMFIRLPDRSFALGFAKALLNIGLMLSLVVVLAVTISCIVKGPVSFFFTLTFFTLGQFFHKLMLGIIAGVVKGGGLVESLILILQHRNPVTGIDATESTKSLVGAIDGAIITFLKAMSLVIPDFSVFTSGSAYIENGFDVPWSSSVLPSLATFFGFLIPCVLIGSALLKFRELEAK